MVGEAESSGSGQEPQRVTVSDVMQRNFVTLSVEDTIAKAIAATNDVRSVVVVKEHSGIPIALARRDQLMGLAGKEPNRSLGEYLNLFSRPGLASPNADVRMGPEAKRFDRSIKWLVVEDQEHNVYGVVRQDTLKATLNLLYRAGLGPSTMLLAAGQLPGLYKTKPSKNLCYICPHESGTHSVHPAQVRNRLPGGYAACPQHRIPMTPKVDCN